MPLSVEEREHLRLFRNAARQIRLASIIAEAQGVVIQPIVDADGNERVQVLPLGEEPFRSLALGLRLTYQVGEPAFFFHIANLIAREGSPQQQAAVAEIRRRFQAALKHVLGWVTIEGPDGPRDLNAKEVFEAWLYGVAFHQDVDRQPTVEALNRTGGHFVLSVQSTALLLSGRVIDLDDQVADLLGQPCLPRIKAAPPDAGPHLGAV